VPKVASTEETEVGCRLDRVPASQIRACVHEQVELVLIALRQDPTGIPPGFADAVGRRMLYEYDLIGEALERGEPVIPMLREELEKARMPPLLHYLALIESGYRPDAQSPARALGMWQFMPGTARQYGMKVTASRDDRRDPQRSTQAAARYLRDLAFEFGGDALLLALASYNRGENGVRRALKKLDDPFSDRSYWRLVEEGLLPVETSRYVTRFVAAAVAGEAGLPDRSDLERAGF
jgi:membrane-bound lytic murein transglycosylase D